LGSNPSQNGVNRRPLRKPQTLPVATITRTPLLFVCGALPFIRCFKKFTPDRSRAEAVFLFHFDRFFFLFPLERFSPSKMTLLAAIPLLQQRKIEPPVSFGSFLFFLGPLFAGRVIEIPPGLRFIKHFGGRRHEFQSPRGPHYSRKCRYPSFPRALVYPRYE